LILGFKGQTRHSNVLQTLISGVKKMGEQGAPDAYS
jgi:hypothetical protein